VRSVVRWWNGKRATSPTWYAAVCSGGGKACAVCKRACVNRANAQGVACGVCKLERLPGQNSWVNGYKPGGGSLPPVWVVLQLPPCMGSVCHQHPAQIAQHHACPVRLTTGGWQGNKALTGHHQSQWGLTGVSNGWAFCHTHGQMPVWVHNQHHCSTTGLHPPVHCNVWGGGGGCKCVCVCVKVRVRLPPTMPGYSRSNATAQLQHLGQPVTNLGPGGYNKNQNCLLALKGEQRNPTVRSPVRHNEQGQCVA